MTPATLRIPEELLDRYATAAPRYTSYPTAVDWDGRVGPEDLPPALERAAVKDDPCAVYVHLPFCEHLCLFCGCNMKVTHDRRQIDDYLDHLVREFEAVGATGFGRRPVTQYHWGGGTPTYLDLKQIDRLQAAFSKVFTFAPDAEVAVEVDPRVTFPEQLRLLASHGFNRLSLGLQDLDPAVQQAVRRIQPLEMTRAVVEAGREAGFTSVNVDLMYGLPHQTEAGFLETVARTIEDLRPERVALFHYAHVPWLKKHQAALPMETAPDSLEKIRIFTRAVEAFTAAGYEYLGLDHFALPDDELARARRDRTLQRNFMGYGTRAGHDLLGLGVSAIGEVDGVFFQNHRDLPQWKEAVRRTGFGVLRGHRSSADDLLRRDIIMRLMCHGIVVKAEIESMHGVAFDETFADELRELEPLQRDGLVVLREEAIELTPLGQVFMRNVAVVFDRYFRERRKSGAGGEGTFSRTI